METALRKAVLVLLIVSLSTSLSFAQGETPPIGTEILAQDSLPHSQRGGLAQQSFEYDPHTLVITLSETGIERASIDQNSRGHVVTGMASLDRLMNRFGVSEMNPSIPVGETSTGKKAPHFYKLTLDPGVDPLEAAAQFQSNPFIEIAEPNYVYKSMYLPDDIDFSRQWALHNMGIEDGIEDADIDAPEAWDIQRGSPDIVVAIIDSGVLLSHPDLSANIWINPGEIPVNGIDDDGNGYIDDVVGWDFVTATDVYPGEDGFPQDNDPTDFQGHGTHVAGIAAAVGDNNLNIAGVCMHCSIMPLRAGYKAPGSGGGVLLSSDILNAIYYAIQNGAHVINMSFGSVFESDSMRAAMELASSHGIVLVAAAGNFNWDDEKSYPAAYETVIAVGSTDKWDQRSIWSTFGASTFGYYIDLAAPGTDILSTYLNSSLYFMSGTSMAAPHVAGAAGLLLSHRPWLTPEEVRAILVSTTDSKPFDEYIGSGRLNVHQALLMSAVPLAEITTPLTNQYASDSFEVFGAAGGSHFHEYFLEYGRGNYPDTWQTITSSSSQVAGGLLADWDLTEVPNGSYMLRLSVTDIHGNTSRVLRRIVVDHEIAPGWPKYLGYTDVFSPIIADLDGDGTNEIIANTLQTGMIYAWRHDGSSLPGWPVQVGEQIRASLAIADLTGDGKQEIVVGNMNLVVGTPTNSIFALRYDGTSLPGWPIQIGGQVLVTPAIGDLDGDGELEIVASSWLDYTEGGKQAMVYAWKVDGTTLAGWPKTLPLSESWPDPYTSGPALGDLTGDGKLEVVVSMMNGLVYAWNYLGELLPGWPQEANPGILHHHLGQIVLGDLTGDGKLEVVSNALNPFEVRVWDVIGNLLPGWPFSVDGQDLGPASLADLNGDGKLEIIAHSNNDRLYAWQYNGNLLPGWPVNVKPVSGNLPWSPPTVGDVNGDGRPDVLWASPERKVYAFQGDGQPLPSWQKDILWWGSATPALGDLNGDGLLNLVVPSSFHVYVYDLPSPAGYGQVQWGTYQHNPARTGRYEAEELPQPPPTQTPPPQEPIATPLPPLGPTPAPTPEPQSQLSLYLPLFFKP
jgi:subtilisin family serine protease